MKNHLLRAVLVVGALLTPFSTARADEPLDDLFDFFSALFSGGDRDRRSGRGIVVDSGPGDPDPTASAPRDAGKNPSASPGPTSSTPGSTGGTGGTGSVSGGSPSPSFPDHVYSVPSTPFDLSTNLSATDPSTFLFTLPPAYGFEISVLSGPAIESLTIYDPLSGVADTYLVKSGLDQWLVEEGQAFQFPGGLSSFQLFHTGSSWTDFAVLLQLESGYVGAVELSVRTLNAVPQPVPEPTTAALLACAVGGLAFARRRKLSAR